VTFFVDGQSHGTVGLNTLGKAVINLGALPLGSHSIQAVYSGSATHNGSAAGTSHLVRGAAKLTATLVGRALPNQTFNIVAVARGLDNSVVPGFNQPATLRRISGPGTVTDQSGNPSPTVTFSNGVVTFGGLKVSKKGTYKLVVSAGGLNFILTIGADGRQT